MQLKGYRRADGRMGFRNHVLILPTVACSNGAVQRICHSVPEAIMLPVDSGCGLLREDREVFATTLVNLAGNPNIAATLVVGLGCEAVTPEQAAAEIERFGKPVKYLGMHSSGGYVKTVEKGIELARQLVQEAALVEPEPALVSDLMTGLNCGASDPASGITANTALGAAVDRIVDQGGSAIIGEITECVGAETEMAKNAANEEVGKKFSTWCIGLKIM